MKTNIFESEKEKYIHSDYHSQIIVERYNIMNKLQTALEFGNIDSLEELSRTIQRGIDTVNQLYTPTEENISVMRNQLTSMNTFCVMTVLKSNPNPLYVHTVSRHYDTMINKVTSRSQAKLLLNQMFGDYCTFSVYNSQKEKYSSVVQNAIWIITADPAQKLDLNQLSKRIGITGSSLSRKFHAETGKTLSEFHTAFRIRFAQRCFQDGEKSITQVAYQTGFADSSYFTKVFTRVTGKSPTEYVRQLQEEPIASL